MRRAATVLLLLALCAPVRADASEHRVLVRRAEVAERALGDLLEAARLYREAATAADLAADRARAEIRAAACLARAGKSEEAVALARPWLEPSESQRIPDEVVALARGVIRDLGGTPSATEGLSVPPTTAAADASRAAELDAEVEQLRLRIEQLVKSEKGAREDLDELAVQFRAKDEELERLREVLPPPDLGPEELLALRQREIATRTRKAKRDSRIWTNLARVYHQDGQFTEARAALQDALQADKDNPEAKALLGLISAPYGDREQLYLRVQELLALAREVRAARVAAEAETLVHEARRALDAGEPSAAAALLERALASVDSDEAGRRTPARLREEIVTGLRRTEAAGVGRAPQPSPPPSPLGERWTEALLALLQEAGAEVAGGLTLRFHDLQPALPAMARALPPVPLSAPPAGWTLRATDVTPAPLLAAWLAGDERAALLSAGAKADLAGGTLVLVAPAGAQERVSSRLSGAALAGPRAAEVEIVLLREEPGALLARLRARGLAPFDQPGGGSGAVLPPSEVAALLADVDDLPGEVLVRATFRATHLRPFRLTRRDGARVLTVDVLPVAGPATGVAIEVGTTWERAAGGVPLSAGVRGGGSFARGGALVLGGVPDPADAARSLTALVRVGREAAPAPLPAAGAGGASPSGAPAGMRVVEHRLPHVIASLEDTGELPLAGAGDRFRSRDEALQARLETVAAGAASVELTGDRVIVVGPQAAHDAVSAFLGRLGAVRGLQSVFVELHSLSAADAGKLVELVPSLARVVTTQGDGVAQTLVTDRAEQGRISWLLTSRSRRIPLLQTALSAPPTGRDHAGHVTRSPFRVDLGAVPGDPEAWGRAQEGELETGVVVAIRPFGRTDRGRDDIDVHVRSVLLAAAGETERATPLGDVPVLAPEAQGLAATLRAQIGPREVLLVTTPHDPFAAGEDDSLLVIVLRRGR